MVFSDTWYGKSSFTVRDSFSYKTGHASANQIPGQYYFRSHHLEPVLNPDPPLIFQFLLMFVTGQFDHWHRLSLSTSVCNYLASSRKASLFTEVCTLLATATKNATIRQVLEERVASGPSPRWGRWRWTNDWVASSATSSKLQCHATYNYQRRCCHRHSLCHLVFKRTTVDRHYRYSLQ